MTDRKPRVPRHTLDRDAIAAAALDLMDRDGVRALTIRALAARLGVAPMSLYNHATTKDEILDLARDRGLAALSAADPGPQGAAWSARLREINLAFHRALRAHPSLVALVVARPLAGQAPMGAAEAQVRVLVEAGFPPEAAARAHLALLHYAIGAAAWTAPRGHEVAVSRAALTRLPADRYPTLVDLAEPLATATHDEHQYAFGLDLLLAALAGTRPATDARPTADGRTASDGQATVAR
jgi:TetR/AcrR family transcriptional regulator, tetracycline repressor protein